jgi:hypothetical protein
MEMKRKERIAKAEEMDGKPLSYYRRVVGANRCDLRTCIQSLEMGTLPDVERMSPLQRKAVRSLVARAKTKKAKS